MQVPIVAIVYPQNKRGGYVWINQSDFDPAVHQVYDPNAPKPEPSLDPPVNPVTPGPASDVEPAVPEPAPTPQEPAAPVAAPPVPETPVVTEKKPSGKKTGK